MDRDALHRRPAVEREIGAVTGQDRRVRLLATVIGKEQDPPAVTLDDGTGSATAFFDDIDLIERLESVSRGDMVKLVGRVVPAGSGFELRGEALEKVNNIDVGLLKRVRALESRTRGE